MSNQKRKELILKYWMKNYSPISIVNKLQGEVTLKEVYHFVGQSEEAKKKHKEQLRLNKELAEA